jgi:S1/P1 nuclease
VPAANPIRIALSLYALVLFTPTSLLAWGYQGHEVVGSIAEQLLNAKALQHVKEILNFTKPPTAGPWASLQIAGPWADCVRSVVRDVDGFEYVVDPAHLEFEVPCTPFKSPEARGRIVDYAGRNWTNCKDPPPGGCHGDYHFVDVAIQRDRYDRKYFGTNDHDLVSAIGAAIAVLTDKPAPPPFSIKDKKEALLMLVHFVGDLHQPLHVGGVYLDPQGKLVDPDPGPEDPATETHGGNLIQDQNLNLHHEWDDIPTDVGEAFTKDLLEAAGKVPPSQGVIEDWPAMWASDTVLVARDAFAHLSFKPIKREPPCNCKWAVVFEDHSGYLQVMDTIKRQQLAKGGAHLAEILNMIWH